MKKSKTERLNQVKQYLDSKDIFYIEMQNGLLRIDNIDLWATTGKWFNRKSGKRGVGVNSMIKELAGIDNEK